MTPIYSVLAFQNYDQKFFFAGYVSKTLKDDIHQFS